MSCKSPVNARHSLGLTAFIVNHSSAIPSECRAGRQVFFQPFIFFLKRKRRKFMKRLVTLAIMVAFLLGTVGMVKAAQLTISGGDFRVHGNFVTNPNFESDFKEDTFNLYQRFRTTFNFVANENLRAVVQLQFNMGERWGTDYQLGGDQDVRFRQSYLQFMVPNTNAQVRAGWQWWALPNTLGSHIFDARAPAVIVSSPINDMIGVTLGFARTSDIATRVFDNRRGDFTKTRDEVDHYVAIVPITMDGFNINPFVHYARVGKYTGLTNVALDNITSTGNEKDVDIFFFGINATMDMFDPIVVHADFNYGEASKPASGTKGASGWIADLAVEYKMDMFTPMVFALYETGESRTSVDIDRKGKVMPSLGAGDLNFTSFSTGGAQFGGTAWYAGNRAFAGYATGAIGRMALGLKVKDISFMDKLSHQFLVAYYQGTNHKDHRDIGLFTTKDSAWELNFDTSYQVYENLAAILELGYIGLNLSEDNVDRSDDDSFKAALGVRYRF